MTTTSDVAADGPRAALGPLGVSWQGRVPDGLAAFASVRDNRRIGSSRYT
jgi:hypothetical protein